MESHSNAIAAGKRPGHLILIAMAAIGPIALNIFIPSMPGLQAALGTDQGPAQLTLTLFLLSLAVSQLIVGPISDRFGRRPVFLAGITLYIVASLGCAFATTIEQLILGRVIQAAGGCTGIVVARAIVRDLYDRDKAASLIGYITMAMALAPMIAPTIGGFLDEWAGWRSGFYLVGGLGLVVLALALAQLHETHHDRVTGQSVGRIARNSAALLLEPAFLGYALCSSFGSGMFFAFIAGAPFIVTKVFNLSPSVYGLYFILVSIGYILGNFLSGRFSQAAGANRMLLFGNAFALVGLALLITTTLLEIAGPLAIFGPMCVIAVSNGLSIPNATAAAVSVRPKIAGAGSGLTGFLQVGLGALATLAVARLHDGTSTPMVAVMVSCGLIAVLFLGLALWASRGRPSG